MTLLWGTFTPNCSAPEEFYLDFSDGNDGRGLLLGQNQIVHVLFSIFLFSKSG